MEENKTNFIDFLSPVSPFAQMVPSLLKIYEDTINNSNTTGSDFSTYNKLTIYISDFIKQESFEHRFFQALKYSYLHNIPLDKKEWFSHYKEKELIALKIDKQFENLKYFVGKDRDYMGLFEYNTEEHLRTIFKTWERLKSGTTYGFNDKFFINLVKDIENTENDIQPNKRRRIR